MSTGDCLRECEYCLYCNTYVYLFSFAAVSAIKWYTYKNVYVDVFDFGFMFVGGVRAISPICLVSWRYCFCCPYVFVLHLYLFYTCCLFSLFFHVVSSWKTSFPSLNIFFFNFFYFINFSLWRQFRDNFQTFRSLLLITWFISCGWRMYVQANIHTKKNALEALKRATNNTLTYIHMCVCHTIILIYVPLEPACLPLYTPSPSFV